MASQITSLAIVYLTVYSGADRRKHQSSASLAFVQRNNRWPATSPHTWPVTQKMFPFHDVIMNDASFFISTIAVFVVCCVQNMKVNKFEILLQCKMGNICTNFAIIVVTSQQFPFVASDWLTNVHQDNHDSCWIPMLANGDFNGELRQ